MPRAPKHAPDSTVRARQRAALEGLHRAMLPLHKALIEATKQEYAAEHGAVDNPYELLQLLGGDPFFEWFKPMTAIIVRIDDLSEGEFETKDVDEVHRAVSAMLDGAENDGSFSGRYKAILQYDFDVATTHPAVRRALDSLLHEN
ncbi:MAG: hypothetical protein ACYC7A_19210 [Thermoanaerobaculia bacterium]